MIDDGPVREMMNNSISCEGAVSGEVLRRKTRTQDYFSRNQLILKLLINGQNCERIASCDGKHSVTVLGKKDKILFCLPKNVDFAKIDWNFRCGLLISVKFLGESRAM